MPAVAELRDAVGYSPWWWVAVGAGALLVIAYYLTVLWWTHPRTPSSSRLRRRFVRRLAGIQQQVASGQLTPRSGHHEISATVRQYVARVSDIPAESMDLGQIRESGSPSLAAVIALIYPPQFAGDEAVARANFDEAVASAREVISTWT